MLKEIIFTLQGVLLDGQLWDNTETPIELFIKNEGDCYDRYTIHAICIYR
jgi:hypothetical protein